MTSAPDTSTYYFIHHAMRVTSDQLRDALETMVVEDRRRADAMRSWARGLVGEILAHHHVEDIVFFPALAARVPTYCENAEHLAADHEYLDVVLDRLVAVLDRLATDGPWDAERREAFAIASDLRDHLYEHLDLEDRDIVPLFDRHFSAEEYEALDERARNATPKKQFLFTVPWLAATLESPQIAHLMGHAPVPLRLLWRLTRKGYAKRASYVLGTTQLSRAPEGAAAGHR